MKRFHTGEFKMKCPEKYKGKLPIVWRSRWELKFMIWCDSNPNILEWSSESFAIGYYNVCKQRMARYYPDFTVKVKTDTSEIKKYLIEVKPSNQCQPPVAKPRQKLQTKIWNESTFAVNQAKWKAAEEFSRKNGYIFKIITEIELFGKKPR